MSRYLYVIEPTATGFSAFVPDLLGCAATGATREEAERAIRDAIAFHVTGMRAEGLRVPTPSTVAGYADIPG